MHTQYNMEDGHADFHVFSSIEEFKEKKFEIEKKLNSRFVKSCCKGCHELGSKFLAQYLHVTNSPISAGGEIYPYTG